MEEESEKRRKRLMSMRMEAAQSGINDDLETSGSAPHALSNPLIERETPVQYSSPRFDYYTDPMSAFSANKRRNDNLPQVSPQFYNMPSRPVYPEMTSNPTYQRPPFIPPDQMAFQAPGPRYIHSPSSMGQVIPPRSWGRSDMTQGHPPRAWGGPNMAQGHPPRARGGSNMAQGHPPRAWGGSNMAQGNPPRAYSGSNPSFNHNYPPNLPSGTNFTNPGIRQGESPYVNYGRGSPNPKFERGRGSGRGGGRGRGPHVSAEEAPDLYYNKGMIADPWKFLNPVVFKFDKESWLPPSLRTNKSKVSSGEASHISIPQQTLAEILAASFNDSSNEAVGHEPDLTSKDLAAP